MTLLQCIVLSSILLSLFFVIVYGLFGEKRICAVFFVYIICLLLLEIQLSRGNGWDPIYRFPSHFWKFDGISILLAPLRVDKWNSIFDSQSSIDTDNSSYNTQCYYLVIIQLLTRFPSDNVCRQIHNWHVRVLARMIRHFDFLDFNMPINAIENNDMA